MVNIYFSIFTQHQMTQYSIKECYLVHLTLVSGDLLVNLFPLQGQQLLLLLQQFCSHSLGLVLGCLHLSVTMFKSSIFMVCPALLTLPTKAGLTRILGVWLLGLSFGATTGHAWSILLILLSSWNSFWSVNTWYLSPHVCLNLYSMARTCDALILEFGMDWN